MSSWIYVYSRLYRVTGFVSCNMQAHTADLVSAFCTLRKWGFTAADDTIHRGITEWNLLHSLKSAISSHNGCRRLIEAHSVLNGSTVPFRAESSPVYLETMCHLCSVSGAADNTVTTCWNGFLSQLVGWWSALQLSSVWRETFRHWSRGF